MHACDDAETLISAERLKLFAQPVCDVASGAVAFEELLLRIRQSDGRLTGPRDTLAEAERTGTVTEIDKWVLGEAVALAATGRALSVNVSTRSLSDSGFSARIDELLASRDVEPSLLTFEITETALMSDLIQAARFAERLEAQGCRFALDDFGTGYAALTYLKHLPVRYLKIDISFIRDLLDDPRSQAVVAGIVALAGGFSVQTVAEGVTDGETLELLERLGVDLAQGFFIERPSPAVRSRSRTSPASQ
jgi:EAL domain-containing protein (putative c-di-GMP-specific phosphodiesterase class I)